MRLCRECKEREASAQAASIQESLLCQVCIERNRKLKEREKLLDEQESVDETVSPFYNSSSKGHHSRMSADKNRDIGSRYSSSSSSFFKSISVLFYPAIIVAVVYFLSSTQVFSSKLAKLEVTAPKDIFGNTIDDPCEKKNRCLIIYVTPWCPSCHSSVNFIRAMRSFARNHSSIGFQVIVGKDSQQAMFEFASKIGGDIYFDPDGITPTHIRQSAVPSWVVIDQERRRIKSGAGLPDFGEESPMFKETLEKYFKLIS